MDNAAIYDEARARIVDLVKNGDATAPVPTCPGWTVKDVVGHLGSLLGTFIEGDPEQLNSPTRNDEQVAARKGWGLEDCLAEWDENVGKADAFFESQMGVIAVSDVLAHEQDIRTALDKPGHRDEEGVVPSIEFALNWVQKKTGDDELPTLRIVTDDVDKTIGEGDPAVTLRTSTYELWRTLHGRRSLAQVRALDWEGDAESWAGKLCIFGPAEADINE